MIGIGLKVVRSLLKLGPKYKKTKDLDLSKRDEMQEHINRFLKEQQKTKVKEFKKENPGFSLFNVYKEIIKNEAKKPSSSFVKKVKDILD